MGSSQLHIAKVPWDSEWLVSKLINLHKMRTAEKIVQIVTQIAVTLNNYQWKQKTPAMTCLTYANLHMEISLGSSLFSYKFFIITACQRGLISAKEDFKPVNLNIKRMKRTLLPSFSSFLLHSFQIWHSKVGN